jgi:eukaryotic-like serine/threonine-protein kinase
VTVTDPATTRPPRAARVAAAPHPDHSRRMAAGPAGYSSGVLPSRTDDGGDMDDEPRPDDAAPTTVLAGRYEVGPLVGIGGTAQVHRAWDRGRGCPVAVKVFRPGAAPAPGYGGARELEVLTDLRYPGLVGVHDAGVDPQGCPFVVMDFVDGQSLSAQLHDGRLPVATVVRLGAVLADALAVVHRRGVVHRDVKPANVLLDTGGHPWLTDFGIARIVDATRVTATGIVVGTAAYMAPEQVRGEAVGPAADVYALGLVLLEAVTGHREYEGGAVESALARLHRAPVVPATVPEPLATVVRAMTAPVPGNRPTAVEVAEALRTDAAPRRADARRRAVPVLALASLVAAAFAGATTLTGMGSSGAGPAAAVQAAAPAPPPRALTGVPLVPDPGAAIDAVNVAMAATRPVPVALGNRDPSARTAHPPIGARPQQAAATDDRNDDRGDDTGGRGAKDADRHADDDKGAGKDDQGADDRPGKNGDNAKGGDGDGDHGGKGDHGSATGSGKSADHGKGGSGKD